MSVTFKKLGNTSRIDIVVTIPGSPCPFEDLHIIHEELISCLQYVDMEGRDQSYHYLLGLLKALIPNEESYQSFMAQKGGKSCQ